MIQTLPVSMPLGVKNSQELSLPQTRVVKVHGIVDTNNADILSLPNEKDDEIFSSEDSITFSFFPSRIVGEDSSEGALEVEARKLLNMLKVEPTLRFILWAEDIGGAIVKLALSIAAREPEYEQILNATQAVIFFGTPHRASVTHSLDSAILAIVEACYEGLLGTWLPATLNRLARQIEDIHKRFSLISHQFNIITYYQISSEAWPVIVALGCATLGIPNEIAIGCDRPHKDIANLMSRGEQSLLQAHMSNIKFGHWARFRHFLDVLECAVPKLELQDLDWILSPSTEAMKHCSMATKIEDWMTSERASRYMRVTLEDPADMQKLFNSMRLVLYQPPGALFTISAHAVQERPDEDAQCEIRILISLLYQILIQQPRIFFYIQHIIPAAIDSLKSLMDNWKKKALWLCLRTVMYAPLDAHTYGFLDIRNSTSTKILRQIDLDLQGTESMFRMILISSRKHFSDTENVKCHDLDFKFKDLKDSCAVDTANFPSYISTDIPADVRNVISIGTKYDPQYSKASEGNYGQLLALRIQALGRPIFIALMWIAFTTRPLRWRNLT